MIYVYRKKYEEEKKLNLPSRIIKLKNSLNFVFVQTSGQLRVDPPLCAGHVDQVGRCFLD